MRKEAFLFFSGILSICLLSTPINGQTLLTEDFTTATDTIPPSGWLNLDNVNSGELWEFDNPGNRTLVAPISNPAAIFDSDNYGNNGTPENAYLVSPAFDASGITDPIILSFDHYFRSGFGGSYSISVFNGNFWVGIASGSANSTSNPQAEYIDITSYINGVSNAKVRFQWQGDYSYYWILDNIKVEGVSCFIPSDLGTYYTNSNSASVFWTSGGASNWNVQFGTSGFSLGSGSVVAATNDTMIIGGLNPETSYDFYVQDSCAVGDVSSYVGPFTFTTSCTSINSFPYVQDFENNGSIPSCWANETSDDADWVFTSGSIGYGATDDITSGTSTIYYAAVDDSHSSSSDTVNSLLSPAFDLSGLTNPELVFYYFIGNRSTLTSKLIIDVFNGSTWHENVSSISFTSEAWLKHTLDLTPYSSTSTKIRFRGVETTDFQSDLSIDDVIVQEAPSCPDPSAITLVSVDISSATISWTSSSGTTNWNVQYDTSGFALGSGTVLSATNDTITISGLTSGSTYDFYVQDSCSSTDVSQYSTALSVTIPCPAFTAPFIESFGSGSIPYCWYQDATTGGPFQFSWTSDPDFGPNTAFPDHTNGTVSAGYTWVDMSGIDVGVTLNLPLIDVSALTEPELSFWMVSTTASTIAPDYNILYAEAFDGSNWVVMDSVQDDFGAQWVNFKVDLSPYVNSTSIVQLRFRQESGGSSLDYNNDMLLDDVEVREKVYCLAPSDFTTVSNAANSTDSTSSVILSWTSGGASNWNIQYGPTGFSLGNGTEVAVTSNTTTISGLPWGSSYDFYVQDSCGLGFESAFIGPLTTDPSCRTTNAPFLEDFSSGSQPFCWSQTAVNGGPFQFSWTLDPDFGSRNAFPDHTNGTPSAGYTWVDMSNADDSVILNLPTIRVGNLTKPELSFWVVSTTSASIAPDYNILYAEAFDGMNWQIIESVQGDFGAQWVNFVVDISAYVSNANTPNVQLRFRQESGGSFIDYENDMLLDDVEVREEQPCLAPTNLSLVSSTDSSITLSWISGGASAWNVEYGASGFTLGTGTTIASANDTLTISSLNDSTAYDFYVQDSCAITRVSAFSGPLTASTSCGIFTAPFIESFDLDTVPSCWSQSATRGGGFTFNTNFTYPDFGTPSLFPDHTNGTTSQGFAWVDMSNTDINALLNLPIIDVSTLTNPELSFWVVSTTTNSSVAPDYNILYVEAYDGNNWVIIETLQGDFGQAWVNFTVDLSAYVSTASTMALRFRQESGGSIYDSDNDMLLDDVEVREAPPCPKPSFPSVISFTDSTVTLSWADAGNASSWNIEYGTSNFVLGTGNVQIAGNDTVVISGLTGNTSYDFYVEANCGIDGLSAQVGPLQVTTSCSVLPLPYIETFESSSPNLACVYIEDDWEITASAGAYGSSSSSLLFPFSSVSSGTYSVISAEFEPTPANHRLSIDYTKAVAFLSRADSVKIYYSVDGGSNYSLLIGLDGGINGELTTVGQVQGFYSPAAGDWSTLYIPLPIGVNRLKIDAISDEGNDLYFDNLTVDSIPQCIAPSGFTIDSTSTTSISTSWNSDTSTTNGYIEYGVQGFSLGSGVQLPVSQSIGILSNLAPATCYDIYVVDSCADGLPGVLGPIAACTDVPCVAPSNFAVDSTTISSIAVSWNSDTNITSGYVEYGSQGFVIGSGSKLSYTQSVANISNLTAGTCYDVYVVDSCANGSLTSLGPITVCTDIPCAVSTLPTTTNDSVCIGGTVTFSATAGNGNSNVAWMTHGDVVAVSDSISLNITTDTAVTAHDYSIGGPKQKIGPPADISFFGFNNYTIGQFITVMDTIYLDSTSVRASGYVNARVVIWDVARTSVIQRGEIFETDSNVTAIHQVPINVLLLPGSYLMEVEFDITGTSLGVLSRSTTGVNYPYTLPNLISITGVNLASPNHYYNTYDLVVSPACIGSPVSAEGKVIMPSPSVYINGNVCETDNNVDLASMIGAHAFGGTWTDINTTGALTDSIFNATVTGAGGPFNFTYVVQGNDACATDTVFLSLLVDSSLSAGLSSSINLCTDDPSTLDLSTLITGADLGGLWEDLDNSGMLVGTNQISPSTGTAGVYRFRYVVPQNVACQADSSILTVTLENAVEGGDDANDTTCVNSGITILSNYLSTAATAGGTWIDVDASGGLFGFVFDPSSVTANTTYELRYLVSSMNGNCTDSASVFLFVCDDVSNPEYKLDNIRLYPNPTKGILFIENRRALSSHIDIEIYSLSGKLILTEHLVSGDKQTVDVNDLPSGVYHVKVQTNDVFKVFKVVVQD